jgi:SAM-dependent methyltransferase
VRGARRRFPDSRVEYVVPDLLDPPAAWLRVFHLVVESITVQALPDPPRAAAIANVARLVAPGGRLLVLAAAREPNEPADGPPWPLTRTEVEAFALRAQLETVRIEDIRGLPESWGRRWRAEFRG